MTKCKSTFEVVADLAAFASIALKLGCESILDNQTRFITVANDVGFRTPKGCQITKMGYRQMIKRLTPEEKRLIIDELREAHRDYDINLALFGL